MYFIIVAKCSFPFGILGQDHLCYLCLVFVMLLHLFIAALWSPKGKGLTSWLLFVMFIVILLLLHLVSYLIVLIPDPCCLIYFDMILVTLT